jgi:uncharacterized protein (TIGR04255 family)
MKLRNPPLKEFRVNYQWDHRSEPSIPVLHRFDSLLRDMGLLSNTPITLNSSRKVFLPTKLLVFPQYLEYSNPQNTIKLELFCDSVIYSVFSYSTWPEVLQKIIQVLDAVQVVSGGSPKTIQMGYTNEFVFPGAAFSLNDHFTIGCQLPTGWTLDYSRFILGVQLQNTPFPFQQHLRGEMITGDKVCIQIESEMTLDVRPDLEEVTSDLTRAHDFIEEGFLSMLSPKTKELIGYSEGEN